MEGFMVTCPLAPSVPHLLSSSCASPRAFGLGFLQTPPRDDALALFLAFGSANTWRKDFHLTSSVPCPAHTLRLTGGPLTDRPVEAVVSRRWLRGGLRDLLPADTEVLPHELIGGIQGNPFTVLHQGRVKTNNSSDRRPPPPHSSEPAAK